jgi:pyruvate kinase
MSVNTEITGDGVCPEDAEIKDVLKELTAIRADMVAALAMSRPRLNEVHSNCRDSAYLALRRHDLRRLQLRLAALGLSSLGRAEVARPSHGRRGPGSAPPTSGSVLATELGGARGR